MEDQMIEERGRVQWKIDMEDGGEGKLGFAWVTVAQFQESGGSAVVKRKDGGWKIRG